MKLLELFSGTHSVGKVAKTLGYEVTSLDIDGRADINCDIMEWDYTTYPSDYFQCIWSSPPCDNYSCMNYCRPEKKDNDLSNDDNIVKRTIEINNYFKPKYWFIENPATGMLKNRPFMKELNYYDCDYCMYGYGLKKRTRIWTNKENLKLKKCDKSCGIMINNKHPSFRYYNIKGMNRLDLRHTIPEKLIYELLEK